MQYGWPESIRDAVRRPLFAIVMGLKRRAGATPQSKGELLAALVADVVEHRVSRETKPVLRQLACLVTENQGPVDRGELGGSVDRLLASASRIVREEEGKIDFALPLLAQWFAADALIAGDVTVAELVTSRPRLDRWRYALAIALSTGPGPFIDAVMQLLASTEPAFAAEIVEDSFQRWATPRDPSKGSPRTALEAGTALRSAITTWDRGVGALGSILLAHSAAGKLLPLGTAITGAWLTIGWYRGTDAVPAVSELPADLDLLVGSPEWAVTRGGQWDAERGWSWRWGLELLREDLKRLLETRSLRTADEGIIDEALWLVALECAGRGASLNPEPVSIKSVEAALARMNPALPVRLRDRLAHTDQLIERVRAMRNAGATAVESPWPSADQLGNPGGTVWDIFSPEQQLRRTQAVYAAAIKAYEAFVAEYFEALKPRMRIAVTLPATLRGTYQSPDPSTAPGVRNWDAPILNWYLDPLPNGSTSDVAISFATGDEPSFFERGLMARERYDKLLSLRTDAVGWLSSFGTRGLPDVFQAAPLVPLVYGWLKKDLSAIDWL